MCILGGQKGFKMSKEDIFYLVGKKVLPDVFIGVIEAKRLLKIGKALTVNEAVKMANISRSAFYKYRDWVFPFTEGARGKIITLSLILEDAPGILSKILNTIAKANGNVITINQHVPIHGIAYVTLSIDTNNMEDGANTLIQAIRNSKGVRKTEILAQE